MKSPRTWFRSWVPRTAFQVTRTRLAIESLEDRTVPTAVAVPSGLVSWWTANSTAADSVGTNPGTLNNGVTYASGEVSSAFSFNNSDYVSAKTTGLPTGNIDRTMEMWVKVNAFSTNESFFAGYGAFGTANETYQLGTLGSGGSGPQLFFSQWGQAIYGPTLQAGQWYHIAVTNVAGSVTLYLNGSPVATGSFSIATPTNTPLDIGRIPGSLGDSRQLNGAVDEVSVYNRALTASEIQGIYKAGSSGKVISPITVSDPSVLEGATGTTTPMTFTIARTGSLSGSMTVNWTTADDTATAGSDYVAASGTVAFAAGQATQTVQVTVIGDNTPEANEDFKLIATPAGGTSILGVGSIINDDASISVGNAEAIEGSSTLTSLGRFVPDGSGGLARARGSVFGPDGNFYVASADTNAILRYDPSGKFIDAFVPSGSGGLSSPVDVAFGPDGNLYVSSYGNNEVLDYSGSTGAFLGVVASGLSSPEGLTFGPDGSLYIANLGTNEVLRSNGSGLSAFVTAGSGGLSEPRKAGFGPDANADGIPDLYVTSEGNGKVLRYDGTTGAFIDTIVNTGTALGIMWLEIGTDGSLYVSAPTTAASGGNKSVSRYNATTGALLDSLALGRDGWAFQVAANNVIYDSGTSAGGFVDLIGPSSIAAFTVSLASASAGTTTVNYSTADGTAIAGSDYVAESGTLTFAPGETSKAILVPTIDNGVGPTKSFTVNLSNPTSGGITSGQGIGTILDDTQFYVADGSDSTYQYASSGTALGNNTLGSGDTAPRGVATTAAGTTEWVVDSNKNIYVYSTGGTLLGSWSAGGLTSGATLTGIATNGADIWLVDSYADKVYKYTGAASRLSGSQTAASSFALASGKNGDPNPQDLATDGTSIWVVDGTALKVFKYSISGSLLGSWSIDPVDTHPTGITIDPTNVSNIWIVDSGTDKVYQYTAAANRTSGSQSAATVFALAAGNTNPQGIADPPPSGMIVDITRDPVPTRPQAGSLVIALPPLTSTAPNNTETPASNEKMWMIETPSGLFSTKHPDLDLNQHDAPGLILLGASQATSGRSPELVDDDLLSAITVGVKVP